MNNEIQFIPSLAQAFGGAAALCVITISWLLIRTVL
jgi:hypothetical protein